MIHGVGGGELWNSPSLEAQPVVFFSSNFNQCTPTNTFIMQWAGKAFKADSYRCRENPVCQHTHTCLAPRQAWGLRAKQLPGGKITRESASLWVSFACVFLAPLSALDLEVEAPNAPHPTWHSTLGMLHSEAFQEKFPWPRNADSESFDVFRWYNKNISRSKAETLLREEVKQSYVRGGWDIIIN